jgi:GTPase SAR1 family protein
MKTIKITTVGDGVTGKGTLLMAFERSDFQFVSQTYASCLFHRFTRELLIDGENIAVDMQHTPGQVRLIDITIDLNSIVYNDIITC